MKEETKKNIKQDLTTGMSSAVGATIGMVAGSTLSAEVNAAEVERIPEIPTSKPAKQEEPVKQENQAPAKQNEPVSTPTTEPTAEPAAESATEPISTQEPEPAPNPDPEVEVIAYETMTNQDGTQSDVAVVSVDGQQMLIADVDCDNVADLMLTDTNGNGTIDEGECVNISREGIMMSPLREAAIGGLDVAQDTDYINDADVNDFMA